MSKICGNKNNVTTQQAHQRSMDRRDRLENNRGQNESEQKHKNSGCKEMPHVAITTFAHIESETWTVHLREPKPKPKLVQRQEYGLPLHH